MAITLKIRKITTIAVLATLVVPAATGCGWAVFNKIEATEIRKVSRGQELIDLQEAKAKGAISDAEYLKLHDQIMKDAETSCDE